MNGKYLLEKMELIDPEFIEAADKKPRKKPIKWQYWTALAACLAVAVASGVMSAVTSVGDAQVVVSPGDTASIFSGGGVFLILMIASLLASLAIAALLIKDREK